jgi:hypothetical protein
MAPYALEGRKVVSRALDLLGFAFTRTTIEGALRGSCARGYAC